MKNKVTVALLNCEGINEEVYNSARCFVTANRLKKTDNLVEYRDRVLSVMSEFILLYYLRTHYGIRVSNFSENNRGKPYIAGKEFIKFNISHTRNIVSVAISEQNIGIDVEMSPSATDKQIIQLIDFCFSEKEKFYINFGEPGYAHRFYEVWTRREAYFKCLGCGLSIKNNKKDISEDFFFSCIRYKNYTVNVCSDRKMNFDLHLNDAQEAQGMLIAMQANCSLSKTTVGKGDAT